MNPCFELKLTHGKVLDAVRMQYPVTRVGVPCLVQFAEGVTAQNILAPDFDVYVLQFPISLTVLQDDILTVSVVHTSGADVIGELAATYDEIDEP